ncbi:MAG: GNAT family N-acetyltransferase [Proteobacteria bacterium]|nr:GNAT family N-acetyltransferase [Pseudomonadota bacterium]
MPKDLDAERIPMSVYIESDYDVQTVSQDNLKGVFTLFSQLRNHLTFENFEIFFQDAAENNAYKLFSFSLNGDYIALVGLRPYCDFVRGKHLYVDDLVVDERHRSKGLGRHLLKWIDAYAKQNNFKCVRLSTGADNPQAMKFYTNNAYTHKAIVFCKKVPSS